MQKNLIATILITVSTCGTNAVIKPATAQETGVDRHEIVLAIRRTLSVPDAELDELRQTATEVAAKTLGNVLVQQALADCLSATATAQQLRAALKEAVEVLGFKPLEEAPLPQGFPPPTPLGEIQVKHYPAYRAACTSTRPGESRAFWRLFRHIESNGIAMTAPVEVTYAVTEQDEPRETEMAFLYRSPEQGKAGVQDMVNVVDMPPVSVVSIGCRGEADSTSVDQGASCFRGGSPSMLINTKSQESCECWVTTARSSRLTNGTSKCSFP